MILVAFVIGSQVLRATSVRDDGSPKFTPEQRAAANLKAARAMRQKYFIDNAKNPDVDEEILNGGLNARPPDTQALTDFTALQWITQDPITRRIANFRLKRLHDRFEIHSSENQVSDKHALLEYGAGSLYVLPKA